MEEPNEIYPQKEGKWCRIADVIAFCFIAFQLLTALQPLPNLQQRAIHLGFALSLIFLIYPFFKPKAKDKGYSAPHWLSIILAGGVVLSMSWVVINYERMVMDPTFYSKPDIILGVILIITVFEASRRTIGGTMTVLALLLLLYVYFGKFIPGRWGHPGFSYALIISELYMQTKGILGQLTSISATIIPVYIFFGILLLKTGGGETFMSMAQMIAGRMRGGAAEVATLASALFGMVSGSGPANVVATGSFTIPMMLRLGYRPEFAGAVEATASTGGNIMPPVMAVIGFLIAEFLGVPYAEVMMWAIVPALLYYLSCGMSIYFEACRTNLPPMPRDILPPWREVLIPERVLCLFPPIIIIVLFLAQGYTPSIAGLYSVLVLIMTYLFFSRTMEGLKSRLRNVGRAMVEAGRGVLGVVSLLAAAQLVVSLIAITGIGPRLADIIFALSRGNTLVGLVLSMITIIVLGMGVPPAAAYILTVSVVGAPLIKSGIDPIAVHMFIFYFSIIGNITPPVCGSVFVACSLSGGNWLKTGITSVKLALPGFIVPFILAYDKSLLLIGPPVIVLLAVMSATIGVIFMAAGTFGWFVIRCNLLERIILIGSGLLLLVPGYFTDLIGLSIGCTILLLQFFRSKKERIVSANI